MTGRDGRPQPLHANQFRRFNPFARPKVVRQDEPPQHPRPERSHRRRNELVRLIDDDVLQTIPASSVLAAWIMA